MLATETTQAVWKSLAEKKIIFLGKKQKDRSPFHQDVTPDQDHNLNAQQQAALDMVLEEMKAERPHPILLQGVTGSGKTEVYLQALTQVLKQKKTALILVPEISLTPQTVQRFRRRFEHLDVDIAVLHSNLSSGERYDQWHIIAEQKAQVVIGARSAVFAPLKDLGMIVVDEEHDSGYKQEETPHYHARDLAVVRGHLERVPVILGSATPSLESVFNAQEKKYRFAKLTDRAAEIRMPTIHIVDMRQEKFSKNEDFMVSAKLKEAVQQRLIKKEQTILFLNRRGFSTSVQCPKCGYVEKCSHCDIPFTFHRTNKKLCCHLCDEKTNLPQRCPECQYEDFGYFGYGTQKVEDVVAKIFPTARWKRVDSDSMNSKHAYEETMEEFHKGHIDLLLGTQMITKGLHFPNVTCVGVINCDKALNLPDFRASERVFQQLVQVAGRAGRGDIHGDVFVQTYSPFHPAIQFARHHDVDGFQDQEMEFRKAHNYPPFSRMILVSFRGPSEDKVKYCIDMVARHLEKIKDIAKIEAPAPAPMAKLRDEYRYQLFIHTHQVLKVNHELRKQVLEVSWPEGIRSTINVDPLNLM
jgi:primosomal protein N' (replication factor Y)